MKRNDPCINIFISFPLGIAIGIFFTIEMLLISRHTVGMAISDRILYILLFAQCIIASAVIGGKKWACIFRAVITFIFAYFTAGSIIILMLVDAMQDF